MRVYGQYTLVSCRASTFCVCVFCGFEAVEKESWYWSCKKYLPPPEREMSSRESKDRKVRKPAGGSSSQSSTAGNEQVLQGIRVNLAASRKSVTPSPVRETATPSPVTVVESSSPGSSRVKSRPSPVESERQRHRHGEQMARIRDNLKPHHKSDPGFNYPPDAVDQDMLHELIMKGYDQVSACW